jgi:hypothetical protein
MCHSEVGRISPGEGGPLGTWEHLAKLDPSSVPRNCTCVARYRMDRAHVFYMKKPRRAGGDTLGTRRVRIHAPKFHSANMRVALVPHTWGAPGRASRASPPRTFRGARRPADRATFLRVGGARNHVAGCPAKTPERRACRPGHEDRAMRGEPRFSGIDDVVAVTNAGLAMASLQPRRSRGASRHRLAA